MPGVIGVDEAKVNNIAGDLLLNVMCHLHNPQTYMYMCMCAQGHANRMLQGRYMYMYTCLLITVLSPRAIT